MAYLQQLLYIKMKENGYGYKEPLTTLLKT